MSWRWRCIALDRKAVQEQGAKQIIGSINALLSKELAGTGLKSHLTGAPVMQLEIRNAVERDQIVYNGLGLLFGAIIAVIFFKRVSLMLLAALPPVLAVLWSLGLLGLLGIKLNLFLNVMTPLVMVMGFADSMQMVSAIRIRLREGDTKREAVRFAVRVVGPACVLAHGTALLSFGALLFSQSALIRTFGIAGGLAVCISFVAVMLVLPLIGDVPDPQRGQAGEGPLARRRADGQSRQAGRVDRRPGGALAVRDHDGGAGLVRVHWALPICSSSPATAWPTRCPTASRRWAPPPGSIRS